jgi:hypothetical protein
MDKKDFTLPTAKAGGILSSTRIALMRESDTLSQSVSCCEDVRTGVSPPYVSESWTSRDVASVPSERLGYRRSCSLVRLDVLRRVLFPATGPHPRMPKNGSIVHGITGVS